MATSKLRKQVRLFTGAVAILTVAGALGLAAVAGPRGPRSEPPPGVDTRTVLLLDTAGRTVPLAPAGGGVVLVVSESCPYCQTSLRRIAEQSGGRGLPGLHVVTLEGSVAGARLAALTGGVRATFLAPPEPRAFARTVGMRATPLTLDVDASGAVVRAVVGELSDVEVAELIRRSLPSPPPGSDPEE